MKRVGIITMHRVVNFGSALQAFALQKVISDMGYECELIDYVYPNEYHRPNDKHKFKTRVAKLFRLTSHWRNYPKIKKFQEEYFNLSEITYQTKDELHQNPPLYDIYVTGSDQVWNPEHMKGDATFLLSFVPKGKKKISYSPSFAISSLDEKYKQNYKELLADYSHISVREYNGTQILKDLLQKDVQIVLDPTLLLSPEKWDRSLHKVENKFENEKYILVYVLNYAYNVIPYIYDLTDHIQRETGYKVLYIGNSPKNLKSNDILLSGIGPAEFISLFKNASFVVTSSFHGTAFAANFNVPFYSVVDKKSSSNDRIEGFLKALNAEKRLIPVGYEISNINIVCDVDFKNIQSNLKLMRSASIEYLITALNT